MTSTGRSRVAELEAEIAALTEVVEEGRGASLVERPLVHWCKKKNRDIWICAAAAALLLIQGVWEVHGPRSALKRAREQLAEIRGQTASQLQELQTNKARLKKLKAAVKRRELHRRLARRPRPKTPTASETALRKRLRVSDQHSAQQAAILEWTNIGMAACQTKQTEVALDIVDKLSAAMPKKAEATSAQKTLDDLSDAERGRVWVLMTCNVKGTPLLRVMLKQVTGKEPGADDSP